MMETELFDELMFSWFRYEQVVSSSCSGVSKSSLIARKDFRGDAAGFSRDERALRGSGDANAAGGGRGAVALRRDDRRLDVRCFGASFVTLEGCGCDCLDDLCWLC